MALGWTPDTFYRAELEDALIAYDGLLDQQVHLERALRTQTLFVISSQVQKPPTLRQMMKLWPIYKDEELIGKEKADQKRAYDERVQEYLKQKREATARKRLEEKQKQIDPHT
jgi:hypothetical protein